MSNNSSLTATLDQPSRGSPIVEGPKAAPSGLNIFGELIGDALTGFAKRDTREKQDYLFKRGMGEDNAKNATVQAMQTALSTASDKLKATQAAIGQGKVPAGMLDIGIEQVKQDLFNKYPEYKYDIAKTMKEFGYDNWEFRALNEERDRVAKLHEAQVKGETDDIDYATKAGIFNPNATPEENRLAGQLLRKSDEELRRTREAWEWSEKMKESGRKDFLWDKDRLAEDAFRSIDGRITTEVNAWLPALHSLIASGLGDVDKEKALSELLPLIGNKIEHSRAQALADLGPMATPALTKQVNDRFDALKTQLSDQFNGGLSAYTQTKQTIERMQNTFKLDSMGSLKAYNGLAQIFGGREVVDAIFMGQIPLNPEVIDKVKAELKGYTGPEAIEGREHLFRAARLLRGDLNIQELDPAEAAKQMPTMAAALSGTQAKVLQGDNAPTTVGAWKGSYGQIVNAVGAVQPNSANLSSLWAGSRLAFSPGARTVITKLLADPNHAEEARALIVGSRGAAAQALMAARNSDAGTNQFQSIRFDGNKFVVDFDAQAYNRLSKMSYNRYNTKDLYNPGVDTRLGEESARKWSQSLTDKVSTMNAALDHLSELYGVDPTAPKGYTPKQVRQAYAEGRPLVDINGKTVVSGDEQFFKEVDNFKNQMKVDAQGPVSGPPVSNIQFTSPLDALVRTIYGEDPSNAANVASVILNRAGGDINKVTDVVLANNGKTWQFDTWRTDKTRTRNLSLDPNSKEYRKILEAILPIVNGTNPRAPYTHYYSPGAMNPVGSKPDWDNGTGVDIGPSRFFTLAQGK